MRIEGRVAVVTGASRGIGRATAEALAARGGIVVATGRDEAALHEVAAATNGTYVAADVRDPAHADTVVSHALGTHGRLDVVVANAGVGHAGSFATMPPERIRELVDVNVTAPMLLCRAALPHLLGQHEGAVVFVTSIAGAVLVPDETVYSTTKAAIESFADLLREETRGTGVRISTVLPGAVDTEFFVRRGRPYERNVPKPVAPEMVAAAVVKAIESDSTRRVFTPRWLRVPASLRRVAPSTYRAAARRFE